MSFKDKEKEKEYRRKYYKKYYHENLEQKEKFKERRKRTYWRIKYCRIAKIKYSEFKQSLRMKWSIEELQNNCREILKL